MIDFIWFHGGEWRSTSCLCGPDTPMANMFQCS